MWGQPPSAVRRAKRANFTTSEMATHRITTHRVTLRNTMLKFRQLDGLYAIVRLAPDTPIPDWATNGKFFSVTRTDEELSIVCPVENIPQDLIASPRWICFKLEGPFPFELTGVLLSFIEPLSSNKIPIFAISTYDTDNVLVQEQFAAAAFEELESAGHKLV
jgi:uncharacterized protein